MSDLSKEEQELYFHKLLPYVRRLARKIAVTVPYSISYDDLFQEGAIGLITSLKRYDFSKDTTVRTYVHTRIKGAMLDYLRALDPLSRSQRKAAKINQEGTSSDISIEEFGKEDEAKDFRVTEIVETAWKTLSPYHQEILILLYKDGLTQKEVGEKMGVTESRICQTNKIALRKLHRLLKWRMK